MYPRLRALIAAWAARRRPPSSGPDDPRLDNLAELGGMRGGDDDSGGRFNPYTGVRAPRKRGPGGRSSAVAVTEPEPDQSTRAVGRRL
jgi:hypothetical protein